MGNARAESVMFVLICILDEAFAESVPTYFVEITPCSVIQEKKKNTFSGSMACVAI